MASGRQLRGVKQIGRATTGGPNEVKWQVILNMLRTRLHLWIIEVKGHRMNISWMIRKDGNLASEVGPLQLLCV
jgi:hypothetical protein